MEEAEAVNKKLPELERMLGSKTAGVLGPEDDRSDREDEDEDGVEVKQGGMKKLFKKLVANANSKESIDVKKDYGDLMKKYLDRTEYNKQLTKNQGGILNTKIQDGLNLKND